MAEHAEKPLVHVRNLSKVFVTERVETHALSDLTFDIERGEYLVVQGPSGCGKSTLLAILGLLDEPTGGEYRLADTDTSGLNLTRRAHLRNRELGFVFQAFNLVADLTIRENVELPLRYRKGSARPKPAERAERAMGMLEDVGIAHRADHYQALLSGAQQQRAAVARALVAEPSLLLADEPTGNLDAESENTVMELLAGCHERGTTLCVVSHNPRFAAAADRTLVLSEGRLQS